MSIPAPAKTNRRGFLGLAAGAAASSVAFGSLEAGAIPEAQASKGKSGAASTRGPSKTRGVRAYNHRGRLNKFLLAKQPPHPHNGDEALYPTKFNCYSKGMPHNNLGEVHPDAYSALLKALGTGLPADFELIPRGGPVRFISPQASLAFSLEGLDSHYSTMPPAPKFASAEAAAEMAEDYWHALCRDVPFNDYATHPLTLAACADLSTFSDYRAPKSGGVVIPDLLFRGYTPGDLNGPYVSQFLLKPIPLGATTAHQLMRTTAPGVDHMKTYSEWLAIQNGQFPSIPLAYDPTPRYIRNGRDLGQWVHVDNPILAGFNACLIIKGFGPAALDDANPTKFSLSQEGFVTFGGPDIIDCMSRVANTAMKCTWFQKWQVHRRARPEVFAGRVHNHLIGAAQYPIHPELLASSVLSRLFSANGNYLLPLAYAEGSPCHPSYAAGHATFAGATCTILKAIFDESFVIPNPVVASSDGLSLLPYIGPPLTIGGELNKLAHNVALGRNIAGVHWRSDGIQSVLLGEQVAIDLLQKLKTAYNEDWPGYQLTKFDGTTITLA